MYFGLVSGLTLVLAFLPPLVGVLQFRTMDTAMKIFIACVAFDFFVEALALYKAYSDHNNLSVYSIGGIIATTMICIYFNYSIWLFRRLHIGYVLAALSAIVGIFKNSIIKPSDATENYFIYFQGILIIILSIMLLFQFLRNNGSDAPSAHPHFWIAIVLISFWTICILICGVNDQIHPRLADGPIKWLFQNSMNLVSCIANIFLVIIIASASKSSKSLWRTMP